MRIGIEQEIWNVFDEYGSTHPGTAYIVIGMNDGGYVPWPKGQIYKNYDPRKRPWYATGMANPGKTISTEPYLWQSELLVGVVGTVENFKKEIIGVIEIDFSLKSLTEIIDKVKIGNTG